MVAVYDYVWTAEDSLSSSAAPSDEPHTEGGSPPESETSTHVVIHTLYLSGLKQRYRHFLRQPDGAIIEVIGELHGLENANKEVTCLERSPSTQREDKGGACVLLQLRKRKKLFARSNRVEPIAGSGCGSSFALHNLTQ
ncbi:hypothetical protein ATANTOWER_009692 [Ataeniobius toweri]|uniref:Uncharacterized protein n=2 Tax=Goodeidae TaxID=28758 RepID=A0ABU7BKG0_9TELE|nr:hypothetical protein [Ataeniobius toweri]